MHICKPKLSQETAKTKRDKKQADQVCGPEECHHGSGRNIIRGSADAESIIHFHDFPGRIDSDIARGKILAGWQFRTTEH